jgi:hypothetical protein
LPSTDPNRWAHDDGPIALTCNEVRHLIANLIITHRRERRATSKPAPGGGDATKDAPDTPTTDAASRSSSAHNEVRLSYLRHEAL